MCGVILNCIDKDLVSIVITTFNRKHLLSRAIISVFNQTYSNIELIVTDDNSDYDVEEYVRQIPNPSNIKVIVRSNNENKGACYTRNEGIKLATGHYYTGLDDDDTFEADRITNFINHWSENYSFLSSNINVIDKKRKFKLFYGTENITEQKLYWYNYAGNQIFTLTQRVRDVGGFDTNLKSAQDLDLWIRIIRKFGAGFRLKDSSYNLFIDHDSPRITTSSSKINGLNYFYDKHKMHMSKEQRNNYKLKIEYWDNNLKFKLSFLRYFSFKGSYHFFRVFIFRFYWYVNKFF